MSQGPDAAVQVQIPAGMLPSDGRFGSGPSKIPAGALEALAATGTSLMGTSHRQAPVRGLVHRVVEGLEALFDVPDGHRVVLGNGGSTAFWEVAAFGLVRERSQHLVHGEFSSKFAGAVHAAPWLAEPSLRPADPGSASTPVAEDGVDAYCWPHNETSTGVMLPVRRPDGIGDDALVLVDATSGAGGLPVDLREVDAYYFAPQKSFASDGGLWIAVLSPAALERAAEITASDRYVPAFLDLSAAIANSAKDQTLNTPAVATLFLLAHQLDAMNAAGGLDAMVARTAESSGIVHAWAEASSYATAFVTDPALRSQVVTTVDLDDAVAVADVTAVLRRHGVVDVDGYRGLHRNQLRIATFPAVEPDDVRALLACVDHVVAAL